MSWGYPPGCDQNDHDAYYDDGARSGEPDDDVVLLDCGHFEAESRGEEYGGKLICQNCYSEPMTLSPIDVHVVLPGKP